MFDKHWDNLTNEEILYAIASITQFSSPNRIAISCYKNENELKGPQFCKEYKIEDEIRHAFKSIRGRIEDAVPKRPCDRIINSYYMIVESTVDNISSFTYLLQSMAICAGKLEDQKSAPFELYTDFVIHLVKMVLMNRIEPMKIVAKLDDSPSGLWIAERLEKYLKMLIESDNYELSKKCLYHIMSLLSCLLDDIHILVDYVYVTQDIHEDIIMKDMKEYINSVINGDADETDNVDDRFIEILSDDHDLDEPVRKPIVISDSDLSDDTKNKIVKLSSMVESTLTAEQSDKLSFSINSNTIAQLRSKNYPVTRIESGANGYRTVIQDGDNYYTLMEYTDTKQCIAIYTFTENGDSDKNLHSNIAIETDWNVLPVLVYNEDDEESE